MADIRIEMENSTTGDWIARVTWSPSAGQTKESDPGASIARRIKDSILDAEYRNPNKTALASANFLRKWGAWAIVKPDIKKVSAYINGKLFRSYETVRNDF